MEGSRIRESKGIIPLFGVYLSLFSVHYYNRLSFEFEKKMGKTRETEAQDLLIQAAQDEARCVSAIGSSKPSAFR